MATEAKGTAAVGSGGGIKTTSLKPPTPATQKSPRELLEAKAAPAKVSTQSSVLPSEQNAAVATVSEGQTEAVPQQRETPAAVAATDDKTTTGAPSTDPQKGEAPVSSSPSTSLPAPRTVPSRPVSEIKKSEAAAKTAAPKAAGASSTTTPNKAPAAPPSSAKKTFVKPSALGTLTDRMADLLGADANEIPPGLRGGSTNTLHTGYFHFMLYGEPNTYKTSTAAEFGGPEHTLFIVTRRSEQLIPLSRKGFKYVVTEDADSLRWSLLHLNAAAKFAATQVGEPDSPERAAALAWAERWANNPDRVVIVDDVTEGTNVLKEDYMYVFNEKTLVTTKLKDPRQAYKKAGDELHDHLKILLGGRQHVGLLAVDKNFDVEGTSDNRTEPDMPNKMMKLVETELEFVFFFPHGDKMLTQTSKVVKSAQLEGKKETVVWNEITFAKCKLPMEYLGKGVVAKDEAKDLRKVWTNVQAAMRGDWKPVAPSAPGAAPKPNPSPSTGSVTSKPNPKTAPSSASTAAAAQKQTVAPSSTLSVAGGKK